jgi:hypothetical protein
MKEYIIRVLKDYWAPAYKYGWWSVLFWIIVLITAALMAYYDIHIINYIL